MPSAARSRVLAVRGARPARTKTADAPDRQGAPSEYTGLYVHEAQRQGRAALQQRAPLAAAGDLENPRRIRTAPNGDLVVAETGPGRIGGLDGWPWFYLGAHEDPRLARRQRELKDQVKVPDGLLQPHRAPLGLASNAIWQVSDTGKK